MCWAAPPTWFERGSMLSSARCEGRGGRMSDADVHLSARAGSLTQPGEASEQNAQVQRFFALQGRRMRERHARAESGTAKQAAGESFCCMHRVAHNAHERCAGRCIANSRAVDKRALHSFCRTARRPALTPFLPARTALRFPGNAVEAQAAPAARARLADVITEVDLAEFRQRLVRCPILVSRMCAHTCPGPMQRCGRSPKQRQPQTSRGSLGGVLPLLLAAQRSPALRLRSRPPLCTYRCVRHHRSSAFPSRCALAARCDCCPVAPCVPTSPLSDRLGNQPSSSSRPRPPAGSSSPRRPAPACATAPGASLSLRLHFPTPTCDPLQRKPPTAAPESHRHIHPPPPAGAAASRWRASA